MYTIHEVDMTENNDTNQFNDDKDIIELTDIISDTENIDDIKLTDSMDKKVGASEEEIFELDDDILDDAITLDNDLNQNIEIDDYLDNDFGDSTDSDSEPDVSKDLLLEPQKEEEDDELKQLIADVVEESQQETAYEEMPATDTPELIPLSSEQVDEALERVIQKMYADRIDSMLTEIIKKTVTKEIEELKALLLKDT